jgi:hypothetical protein
VPSVGEHSKNLSPNKKRTVQEMMAGALRVKTAERRERLDISQEALLRDLGLTRAQLSLDAWYNTEQDKWEAHATVRCADGKTITLSEPIESFPSDQLITKIMLVI